MGLATTKRWKSPLFIQIKVLIWRLFHVPTVTRADHRTRTEAGRRLGGDCWFLGMARHLSRFGVSGGGKKCVWKHAEQHFSFSATHNNDEWPRLWILLSITFLFTECCFGWPSSDSFRRIRQLSTLSSTLVSVSIDHCTAIDRDSCLAGH